VKPSQKIIVTCRQTADSARRLCDWLDANPALLGAAHAGVIEDIEGLASGLAPIAIAAETPPAIAVIGSSRSGKTDLVVQLLGPRGPSQAGELGTRAIDVQTLRNILPTEHTDGGSLAVRLTSTELAPAPRGYPIRFTLLPEVDVAAVLALARLAAPGSPPVAPSAAEAEQLFAEAAAQVSLQPVPGMAGRDILDLSEALTSEWAGHPFISGLAAIRFFERLREIAAHTKEADRRRLLSVLWGRDEAMTALFVKLCDALDKLGHGAEAYATPDALIGKDRVTGWLVRHPNSIVDASTMLALTRTPSDPITVMSRYGQTVELDRAVLAALASELPIYAGPSRFADMAPADLIDFPAPPMIGDVAPQKVRDELGARSSNSVTHGAFGIAVARYAKSKPLYLFQRATRRRDITCLVLAVDPDGDDDAAGPALADWVETAQGVTEHARERVRRGLFIAATPPARFASATSEQRQAASQRVLTAAREPVNRVQVWTIHWSPGRALDTVYWFARSGEQMQTSEPASPGSASMLLSRSGTPDAATDLAIARRSGNFLHDATDGAIVGASDQSSGSPFQPAAGSVRLGSSGVGELTADLARTATARAKSVQLTRAVAELRRQLRNAIARHHVSNDPAAVAEWRRATAIVVGNRLSALSERGRLGRLLRTLLPSEAELEAAIRAAANDAATDAENQPRSTSGLGYAPASFAVAPGGVTLFDTIGGANPAGDAQKLSDAAVAHWIAAMKRVARSRHVCRELSVEGVVIQHIADELQLGAGRIGLSDEIARLYHRAVPGLAPADTVRLAAYAFRLISAYLETLSASGNRNHVSAQTHRSPDVEVADRPGSGYGQDGRPRRSAMRSARGGDENWEQSFAALVDDNISATNLGSPRGDKDRELGSLIQLFAPGPFEGDA